MTTEPAGEWIAPSKLTPWADNPRIISGDDVSRVAASIKRFGFGAPIVARKKTRVIIAGHTRWLAAKELGLKRVPVRLLNVTEKQAHQLALADNKLGELTDWTSSLGELLKDFDKSDVALAGWTDSALAKLEEHLAGGGKSEEIDLNAMQRGAYTCPQCSCEFDDD